MELRLVEVLVFLIGNFRFLLSPDGNHGVEDLVIHIGLGLKLVVVGCVVGLGKRACLFDVHVNRIPNVVAVALHEALKRAFHQVFIEIDVIGVFSQIESDIGAALLAHAIAYGIAFHTVAFPFIGLVASISARNDGHFVCHHKRRVEANAKLANDVYFIEVLLVFGLELEAARMRDGAKVLVELVFCHADAVIADRQDAYLEVTAGYGIVAFLEGAQVELVERV